jgi:glucose-1-phosphate thymidylyltransferase
MIEHSSVMTKLLLAFSEKSKSYSTHRVEKSNERHYSGWWPRHPSAPNNACHIQTTASGIRQARDLLPTLNLDARGIREILIISTPNDHPHFQRLLGDGPSWGISLSYAEQPTPGSVAQAYIIDAEFVSVEPSCVILGDNFFYGGQRPAGLFKDAAARSEGATIFAHHVEDPKRYGVVQFNSEMKPISIEEKPITRAGELPKSHWAVPGLCFYDKDVVNIAANLKPSSRGELEITDINRVYLDRGCLHVQVMGKECDWFDMGTPDSL